MKKSILKNLALASALFAGAFGVTSAQAQEYTGFTGSYTNNFDSALGATGTTPPPGFTSMYISGANSTYVATSPINAAGIAAAVNGSQTLTVWNGGNAVKSASSYQMFNIGCWDNINTDRALGTDPTGTAANLIQLAMTNNTGGTLYGVTFWYDCKCLTNGSAGTEKSELPGYCFFYSTTGTNSGSNWTEVGYAGTTNDPGGNPAAHGLCLPNYTQGTTMSSGPVTILFSTPLTNGGAMYFRWADDNNEASSPDQQLAIDNVGIAAYTGPAVAITAPANSATFTPGSSIAISATASESGGTITNVEFFANGVDLGGATTVPYTATLTSPALGSYALTAVASDASGITATSAVVNVSVAYLPPTISLTSPVNGASFSAPASISLAATTTDTSGTVTNVAFYNGSTLLANVTAAPYTYNWPNVAAGAYTLTAVATDNNGSTVTSSGVSVTVTNPLVASFTGSYTENFDSDLANNATILPAGFAAMYLPGSHFTYTNAPGEMLDSNAIATATVGSGAASLIVWNAGSPVTDASYQLFNVGCWDGLTDRALGTDPTGTAGTVIQLALTNNTGGTISGVNFSYTEKCMTNGSTSNGSYTDDGTERLELPGYEFFYSTVGDGNGSNWYNAPVLSATNWVEGTASNAGPVTLVFSTPLTNGGVMYFRWADDNCVASSPDQMYAIDNISITALNPNGPAVSIASPTNNENYIPDTGITVSVNATDSVPSNSITSVGLYIDGSLAYTFASPPYILPVPAGEIPAGSYNLYAEATDSAGLTATSSVVNFTVSYVPPTVSLTSPASGAAYAAPASIPLSATAASADGTIASVAFYQGTNLLATLTSAPFNYTWANVSAGSYNLTAVATDSHSLSVTSSVVAVTVTNGYGLPVASITSPANGANFLPGSSIPITASASEGGGTITNVEFFANATDLGGVTTAPYTLTWPSVAAGNYALTAVASDASGNTDTSSVVNITVAAVHLPPTVSITSPANGAGLDVSGGLTITASASAPSGSVAKVAFYLNNFPVGNVASAPYSLTLSNAPTGDYTLTAVATDNSGSNSTPSVVSVVASNSVTLATLSQIKTIFIIPLENHDLVQADPTGSPEQLLGNPACPYFNSLITPGNSNAVQTAWATHYFSCAINGEHPSEPNYVWSEAGTDFGVRTDNDPTAGNNQWSNVQHLSGQLTAAGISWKDYQEDVQYSSSEEASASGSGAPVNPYNGTTDYNYAVKHNPMAFFTDTQNKNIYPMTNLWADLNNNNVGRYNWITPDQYNEMHSSLPNGFTYNGTAWTGDQAAIAEGDNALSIIIPKIMASQAYKDHGVIIIWTDETESTDDTNTTLPYVIISPLAKGNAYASTLPYSHSSDLKTMDELFGLPYQTNAIPNYLDAQNTATNYVNGSSAIIYDLSDFFQTAAPALAVLDNGTTLANGGGAPNFGTVNFGATAAETVTVTNSGSAPLVLSNVTVTGVNAGDFTVGGLTLPATVPAGGSAAFTVTFAPTTGAAETATLNLSDNDSNNNPFTVALAGTGVIIQPTVSIASPTNSENYIPGTGITISVNATDGDPSNSITGVGLYFDGSLAYTFTSPPYILPIPGGEIPAGSYSVYAEVNTALGLTATSAVVNITVAYVPPTINLTGPANGSSYAAPASIPLSATAASADGAIASVAFYQGTSLLATVTSAPFNYTWANVSAGSYNLTAVATDSHSLSVTSSVVAVTVTNAVGLPVANITSPANGASFATGSNIVITANASEAGGTITNVEFFANTTDLGGVTTAPYTLTDSNVATGSYALTVVASDAAGIAATSPVVNITVSVPLVPPTVAITSPATPAALDVAHGLAITASASSSDATVTNVSFYLNTFLMGNAASAPYTLTISNAPTGDYTLTAVATDNNGLSTTSSVVSVVASNSIALYTLGQIKTFFIIPLENHDLVQADPTGSPEQLLGNPACPYFNSLITPGNSNAVQTAWATSYYSCAINGEHPSEPNYVWAEAGTDFGVRTDSDPGVGNTYTNVQHLSGQLTTAGIPWRTYQEDVEYSSSEEVSASGSTGLVNPYNGTTDYNYAVKHNPMAFFPDTQDKNCYPLTNFWTDLANGNLGRYNWITPDQYNEMHSSLPNGFTYNGTAWTGNQAAIAEGDNFLSIVIPKIMASQAYQDHGVIIIWTDETESTDDTNTTLPYVIISPLAKGNAYASTLPYNHSSDLKTMDEIFGLAYQTNTIPLAYSGAPYLDAQNTATNYVDGHSAIIYDLSDFFQPVYQVPVLISAQVQAAGSVLLTFSGPARQPYEVLATTDLTLPESQWASIASGTFGGGNATYTDTNTAGKPVRYYVIKSP